ncbi:unnamed protein product [Spirodela intermedia]|uniref:Uncharacterized protein n=1 Tax=Spirodela intermedia TaxID=51605 RepID=A0A7I8LHP8_SPIIN|nr:unnamed protein product [Spirodela intermedia]
MLNSAPSRGLSVVGFAEAERSMTEQLLNGEGELAVISVVGMGGTGKTTIAKKIYRSEAVKHHFDYRAWVTVSQKFTPTELLRSTLRSILDCIPETWIEKLAIKNLTDMQLVETLRTCLENARYLVVIDNIWEKGTWGLINSALLGSPGSRVIITTRIEAVAMYTEGERYRLAFLSEEESWELFCAKVFPSGEGCPPELEEVGKEMVRRCRGLTLAVLVLGGLLIERRGEDTSGSTERDEMIKNIIALSYDDLSDDLKICFLYIGFFPEDMEIDATKLVQLWVAEGFIEQASGLTLEETAEQHLEKLVNRSVLQVGYRDSLGRVLTCRIHDLFLDLARDEGGKNQFLDIHEGQRLQQSRLHKQTRYKYSLSLSSRLLFNGLFLCEIPLLLSSSLPKSIFSPRKLYHLFLHMVRLAFLGHRRTKLVSLPSSIDKLGKLQTLGIRNRMKTLRHLSADRSQPQASSFGTLTELQTLHKAFAGT